MNTNRIIEGDVREQLANLPTASVDCVITSPPYFRLRNYGEQRQIGLEPHVDGWVDELRAVFSELARVLTPYGSVWLNLGDSYSRNARSGAAAKSLLLAPERLLLALSQDGWIIRNKVIWAKTNPIPNSVADRLACTHEYIYFLTRSPNYFFDLDAIRVPHRSQRAATAQPGGEAAMSTGAARGSAGPVEIPHWAGPLAGSNSGLVAMKRAGHVGHPRGKNPGDVWLLPTANFRGAHFATFPRQLVERPLLATCPERVCQDCAVAWKRQPARTLGHLAVVGELRPQCSCSQPARTGVVLDPFFGAGTVGIVAESHGRAWLGVELNPTYVALAEQRLVAERRKADDAGSVQAPRAA